MICSMAAFTLADTLVKVSTASLSPAQVMFFLMGGATVFFTVLTILQGHRLIDRRAFSPVFLLRYVAEVAGMVGMVMALANVPISTVRGTRCCFISAGKNRLAALGFNYMWIPWCTSDRTTRGRQV